MNAAILVYAATSPVNGYFGGSMYYKFGGKEWIKQMLISAALIPSVVCGTTFLINFVAIYYHASRAIPFTSMVGFFCLWLLDTGDLKMQLTCTEKTRVLGVGWGMRSRSSDTGHISFKRTRVRRHPRQG